ncbi:MAG: hypothetical protein ACHQZR_03080, partial [Candidatus Limnocylindrales bacterium]
FLAPSDDPAIMAAVRQQVAFYASTPSYRAVLALHGRERVGERLGRLAVGGRWGEMAGLVDDELLALVAVGAPRDGRADAAAARVAGHADRVCPLLPLRVTAGGELADGPLWGRLIAALRTA